MIVVVVVAGDLYPESDKGDDKEEPEWVKTEREHFNDYRDKNKDGKMDRVSEGLKMKPRYKRNLARQ